MCGPDNFNPNSAVNVESDKGAKAKSSEAAKALLKSHVKFLELSKLDNAEYQMEGLQICILWYLEVLDKQSMKKNQDFHRKLKGVMEDIKAKSGAVDSSNVAQGTTASQARAGGATVQASGSSAINAM